MMRQRFFVPVLILVASGCAGAGSWESENAPDTLRVQSDERVYERSSPPGNSPAARCMAYAENGLMLTPGPRAAIRRGLGDPLEVLVETEPNRHIPDAVDTLTTLAYEGVEFHFRTPPSGDDLIERIVVRDTRHLRYSEPVIGDPRDTVLSVLGTPSEASVTDHLIYECSAGPVPDPLHFLLENDRVREVWFSYYVD